MRRLREILRLKYACGLSHRAIASACGVGAGTVSEYLQRARQAGLTWPLPDDLDDAALEARLFVPAPEVSDPRPLPDPGWMHQELKRRGVTLQLLWLEYLKVHPDGYRYSQFCEHYRRFARTLAPSMRQVHRAGEKAFVDFSGERPEIVDRRTGEVTPAELFVGALGASSYLYAEATGDQKLPSWVSVHVHMLEEFGGCPELLVPDNLKAGVTDPCYYEPIVNRTYEDLARHYGAAVLPARAYHPKDKPKVEANILVVQRWILARLRDRVFFSLAELNAAIRELVRELNDRPMKHLGASRRELLERLDRPALKPLPPTRFEMAVWKECGVNIDYHIAFEHNYYSVPYPLVHQRVEARATATTVEIFLKSRRVASHVRLYGRGQCSTLKEHMPSAHRAHAEWTPSRIIAWAEKTGPATARVVQEILQSRPHPEQGYRACLGLLRLGQARGAERLEAACARAEQLGAYNYRTVKNILASGLDRVPLDETAPSPLPAHDNIRGAAYFQGD
ncbi:MAG: IS21 family transposase [bacterium]